MMSRAEGIHLTVSPSEQKLGRRVSLLKLPSHTYVYLRLEPVAEASLGLRPE